MRKRNRGDFQLILLRVVHEEYVVDKSFVIFRL